jgi:hypothetical protein
MAVKLAGKMRQTLSFVISWPAAATAGRIYLRNRDFV